MATQLDDEPAVSEWDRSPGRFRLETRSDRAFRDDRTRLPILETSRVLLYQPERVTISTRHTGIIAGAGHG